MIPFGAKTTCLILITVNHKQIILFHLPLSEFTSKMERRAGTGHTSSRTPAPKTPLNRSLSNNDVAAEEKTDGSVSDSAVSASVTEGRSHRRRPSLGYKVAALVGLSRKSNSTSQLSSGGNKKPGQWGVFFGVGNWVVWGKGVWLRKF